jgi:hypothetical protein
MLLLWLHMVLTWLGLANQPIPETRSASGAYGRAWPGLGLVKQRPRGGWAAASPGLARDPDRQAGLVCFAPRPPSPPAQCIAQR